MCAVSESNICMESIMLPEIDAATVRHHVMRMCGLASILR